MKDIELKYDTTINPLGRERFYQGSTGKAVLLLHGFTGYPEEMDYLGSTINRQTGQTVYIPRLPGHGTNSVDFQESTARDWLRKTYDSYLKLRSDHREVYPAGLSMGGLLALLCAARFNSSKLVLIAAALYARNRRLPFSHLLKFLRPSIPVEENCSREFNSEDERRHYENYGRCHYTAQIAELHKLMLLARKTLPRINSHTLILASRQDGAVPLKAARRIEREIQGRRNMYIFADSPHVINNGPDREECARLVVDFLQREGSAGNLN